MPCYTNCYLVLSRPRPAIPRTITLLIGHGQSRSPSADLFEFITVSDDLTDPENELRQYLATLPNAGFRLVVTGDKQMELGGYDHHPFAHTGSVSALDRMVKDTRYTFAPGVAYQSSLAAVPA
jgi:hypothetical protein